MKPRMHLEVRGAFAHGCWLVLMAVAAHLPAFASGMRGFGLQRTRMDCPTEVCVQQTPVGAIEVEDPIDSFCSLLTVDSEAVLSVP